LADLRRVALPERIEVLGEQLELLRAATVEAMDDDRDVRLVLDPDREGLGAAAP
jgi:5S rRNA maturation endonuclease (ribonuclease M5)